MTARNACSRLSAEMTIRLRPRLVNQRPRLFGNQGLAVREHPMHLRLNRADKFAGGMALHGIQLPVKLLKLHLRRQIGTVFIQQQAQRSRRQKAI